MTSGNWYQEFQPKGVEQLAVHPQKFDDVRDVIKNVFQRVDRNKYLQEKKLVILSGPPGSGKSATLKLAIDFINQESELRKQRKLPTLPRIYTNKFDPYPIGYQSFYELDITRFKDWINDNVWFATREALKGGYKAQVLLLEELPFAPNHKEQKVKFNREISNYLSREDVRMPIIWIVTETSMNIEDWDHKEFKSVDTVYNTVPINILNDQKVTLVKFNPVAKTYLKRGIKALLEEKFPKDEAIKRECVMKIADIIAESGVKDIRQALNYIQSAYTLMETTEKIPSFVITPSPHRYNRAGRLLNAPRKPYYRTPKKQPIRLSNETMSEINSIITENVKFEKSVGQFECLDLIFGIDKSKIDDANSKPRKIIGGMLIDYEKFGELAFSNYLYHFSSKTELALASEAFSNYDIFHANYYNNKRNSSLILMNGLTDSRMQNPPKTGFVQHKGNALFDFNQRMRKNKDCLWSIKRGKQRLFEEDTVGTQNKYFIMTNHSKEDLAMFVLPYLRQMSKFDTSNVLKLSRSGKACLNEFGKFQV
ncbi:8741_t:CDS:1 [Funneliformis geosporum]|uniref:4627_t:CDS:1 n=1 Tax=Funneliformis geosporum TaxID=1117311 RepID=A0A9W4WTF3_9GLOM|nr:8741_t:CDS:1 [Funneliformis geosporum]CAI2177628.1 4627_t:CDS:1 [Funneliformis geosporum]